MPAAKGRNRILDITAPASRRLARTKELVRPQAGQGMPVNCLKRQGMEKDVWIVKIKTSRPSPKAIKIKNA